MLYYWYLSTMYGKVAQFEWTLSNSQCQRLHSWHYSNRSSQLYMATTNNHLTILFMNKINVVFIKCDLFWHFLFRLCHLKSTFFYFCKRGLLNYFIVILVLFRLVTVFATVCLYEPCTSVIFAFPSYRKRW